MSRRKIKFSEFVLIITDGCYKGRAIGIVCPVLFSGIHIYALGKENLIKEEANIENICEAP